MMAVLNVAVLHRPVYQMYIVEMALSYLPVHTYTYPLAHPTNQPRTHCILQGPQSELPSAGVLSYLSCRVLANLVAVLYVGCLVLSYIAGVNNGTLPTDHVPYISDMW